MELIRIRTFGKCWKAPMIFDVGADIDIFAP